MAKKATPAPPRITDTAPLNRADILNADDLITVQVPTPEWRPGSFVNVRTIDAAERDEFEDSLQGENGLSRDNIRARLCARAIVDASGARLFSDDDADLLGGKSAKCIDRIFDVASSLAGVSNADIEALVKNSSDAEAAADASAIDLRDTCADT